MSCTACVCWAYESDTEVRPQRAKNIASSTLIATSSEGGHICPSMQPPKVSRWARRPRAPAASANCCEASAQAGTDSLSGSRE